MQRVPLHPHPASPTDSVSGIEVEVQRLARKRIQLTFSISANFRHINWPMEARPRRTDELWRHTCFEAFVRTAGADSYFEFNLSPSSRWAAYHFDSYRSGMQAERRVEDPRISQRGPGLDPQRTLSATLDLGRILELPDWEPWRIGLAAVIEERSGHPSYWALAHTPEKPDFHHPDCFALELAPARPA